MSVAPLEPLASRFDFDAFVARHSLRLRNLVLRRIGDPHEAEEILQEALLRAHQHRAQFADDDGAAAWTTVVAQRLVIDRQRVSGRSIAVAELPETARAASDPADIVADRSELRAALAALEALPTRQAAIVWAREVEGLSYDAIAERFELSEPTVRSLLHRGRKALRTEFAKRGHVVPVGGLVALAPVLRTMREAPLWHRPLRRVVESKLVAAGIAAAVAVGVVGTTPWRGEAAAPPGPPGVVDVEPARQQPVSAERAVPAAPAAPGAAAGDAAAAAGAADRGAPSATTRRGPTASLPKACAVAVCAAPVRNPSGDSIQVPLPVPVAGQQSVVVTTDLLPPPVSDLLGAR